MFKSKLIAAAALALGTVALAPTAALAQVDFSVVIGNAPPPLRFESVPPPRYGYVWAPGVWRWDGYRHVWVAGHWLQERPGYRYTPSQWVRVDNGWGWREGGWAVYDSRPSYVQGPSYSYRDYHRDNYYYRDHHRDRYRDRDHDGIPDRYDRDRDNDGVPNRYDRDRDGDGVPNRYDRRPDNPHRR